MNLDKFFGFLTNISSKIVISILIAIFIVLIYNVAPLAKTVGLFSIFGTDWAPNNGKFGGLVPIVGTVLTTFLSMVIAIPFAMGIAVFLSSIINKRLSFISIFIELLAAIPSIIYGMWGLFYLVPLIGKLSDTDGMGLLTASIVISLMILPFIASITKDAIATTPQILCESAYALGATRYNVLKDIIFPYIKNTIVISVILAFGRAIGETMAVTFVLGGVHRFPNSIFAPTTSIPVTLANEFSEASSGDFRSSLYSLALILLVISTVIIYISKRMLINGEKHDI